MEGAILGTGIRKNRVATKLQQDATLSPYVFDIAPRSLAPYIGRIYESILRPLRGALRQHHRPDQPLSVVAEDCRARALC